MAVKVNQARQKLFSKRAKSLDSIPPTIASLEQHVNTLSSVPRRLRMGLNPPLSARASKPIRLGVATAQQLMVTILDSPTVSKGILSRTHSMWMQSLIS